MMQHCRGAIPDKKHGYCLDDNARALIVAILAYQNLKQKKFLKLAKIYLNFISRMQRADGRFHNFLSYDLNYLDKVGSADSFGRAIMALGFLIWANIDYELSQKAEKIFKKAQNHLENLKYLRATAFSIIGLFFYFQSSKEKKARKQIEVLADNLLEAFKKNHSLRWQWFEDCLTYSNAVIPLALFLAFKILKKKKYLRTAKLSFDFLLRVCQVKGVPAPIGQKGWYQRGKKRAFFDQQLVDVGAMVITSLIAHQILKKEKYLQAALKWFSWFWGNNLLKKEMLDLKTGGAYDGLKPTKRNKNQGAESLLAYLLAQLILQKYLKLDKIKIKEQDENC